MGVMERRRALMGMQANNRLELYYRLGLSRLGWETDGENNKYRCSTGPIYVNAGDVLTVVVPDGFNVALGVWDKNRPATETRYYAELYGGWNGNLNYTVQNDNCFARYVYKTVPTETEFQGNELNGKVKIYVNGILYYA